MQNNFWFLENALNLTGHCWVTVTKVYGLSPSRKCRLCPSHKRWWKQGNLSVPLPWWCCCGSLPPLLQYHRGGFRPLMLFYFYFKMRRIADSKENKCSDCSCRWAWQRLKEWSWKEKQTQKKKGKKPIKVWVTGFRLSPSRPPWVSQILFLQILLFQKVYLVPAAFATRTDGRERRDSSMETDPNRTHKWNNKRGEIMQQRGTEPADKTTGEQPCGAEWVLVHTVQPCTDTSRGWGVVDSSVNCPHRHTSCDPEDFFCSVRFTLLHLWSK